MHGVRRGIVHVQMVRRTGVRAKQCVARGDSPKGETSRVNNDECMAQARKGAGRNSRALQWPDSARECRLSGSPVNISEPPFVLIFFCGGREIWVLFEREFDILYDGDHIFKEVLRNQASSFKYFT